VSLRAQPLVELAGVLGIGSAELAAVERVDRLAGTFSVPSSAVAQLRVDQFDAVVSEYGDAAFVEIRTGALPDLTVAGSVDHLTVQRLVQEAATATGASYDVVIDVNKAALGRQLVADPGDATVRVFFFAEVMANQLGGGPRAIEQELWDRPDTHLLVAVLDTDLSIVGDCLSLLGGTHLALATEASLRQVPPDLQRVAVRRNDYVGWDTELSSSLTPAHFRRSPGGVPGSLGSRLDSLVIGLGAMFLCDRARHVVRPDGNTFVQAEYRGREHVAFVPIEWATTLAGVQQKHADAVAAVVDWCYETVPDRPATDMVGDRLPFVQTRVAQLLEGRAEQDRLAGFAAAMPSIAEGVKWQWRSFVEGRINEYLDHVRELEKVVGETVTRLSDQTSSLIKRLSETSLAAVAALIGSFIAAAFKDPFQADLFRIGMFAYAGYVIVFPMIIGVSSAVGDSRVATASFTAQRDNLARVLGDQRVDELVACRTTRAENRFRFWAWLVSIAYLGAAMAAVVAALAVPSVVAKHGAQTPANTTTTALIATTSTVRALSTIDWPTMAHSP
jgi:hypothetical protein